MTIYLKDIISENFIKIIPQFIIRRVLEQISKNNYVAMQEYLKENYKVSIEDVVRELALKGFSYSKVKDLYIVRLNDNIKEEKSQEKLSTLIRLIDYGNLEIKGVHLINNSIEYIKDNILNIYRIYQMKGERTWVPIYMTMP